MPIVIADVTPRRHRVTGRLEISYNVNGRLPVCSAGYPNGVPISGADHSQKTKRVGLALALNVFRCDTPFAFILGSYDYPVFI